jgi:hypothetical protein
MPAASQLVVKRVSIPCSHLKQQHKIMQACTLSRSIYNDKLNRNMVVYPKGDTLYVCFKGCSSWRDYIKSIDVRSCKIHGEILGVHNGYCEEYKRFHNEIIHEILEACNKDEIKDIVFTGHSAGGGVAQLCGLFIYDYIKDNNIKKHCYSFGSPKVGDIYYKDAIENYFGQDLLRIEVYNDIICLLPVKQRFEHVGEALIMKHGKVVEPAEKLKAGFFDVYHKEHGHFMRDLSKYGLLTNAKINDMIKAHSGESYLINLWSVVDKCQAKDEK